MKDNDNEEMKLVSGDEEEKKPEKKSFAKSAVDTIFDWVETIAFAFCFVVVVFTLLFKVVTVQGPSMNYTLYEGQRLIISSAFYTPKRGDIVVIDSEKFSEPIIKRIIAVEGDTVDIDFENWITTVTTADGEVIVYEDEPYVNYIENVSMGDNVRDYPVYVGEGQIFVMGDNRTSSTDSRARGTFNANDIVGRAIFRLWPMDKIGFLS